jgi:hypothetical protein
VEFGIPKLQVFITDSRPEFVVGRASDFAVFQRRGKRPHFSPIPNLG